jgi:hypothetical protein
LARTISGLIALVGVVDIARLRGQEDDGDLRRSLARLHGPRELEAVHVWHEDVHEENGELFVEELSQSLERGAGLDEAIVRRGEDGAERCAIVRLVVDQQQLHRLGSALFRLRHESSRGGGSAR